MLYNQAPVAIDVAVAVDVAAAAALLLLLVLGAPPHRGNENSLGCFRCCGAAPITAAVAAVMRETAAPLHRRKRK